MRLIRAMFSITDGVPGTHYAFINNGIVHVLIDGQNERPRDRSISLIPTRHGCTATPCRERLALPHPYAERAQAQIRLVPMSNKGK
jgi:hypothetical protein